MRVRVRVRVSRLPVLQLACPLRGERRGGRLVRLRLRLRLRPRLRAGLGLVTPGLGLGLGLG